MHDAHLLPGAAARQDDQLALLVPVCQDLQAVCRDGQELNVVALQEGHHLLEAAGEPDRHLRALLVEQQVVKRGDGVEKNRLHGELQEIGQCPMNTTEVGPSQFKLLRLHKIR